MKAASFTRLARSRVPPALPGRQQQFDIYGGGLELSDGDSAQGVARDVVDDFTGSGREE